MNENGLKISVQTFGIFDARNNDPAYLDKYFSLLKECGFEAIDYNTDTFVEPFMWNGTGETGNFWEKPLEELYEYFRPVKEAALRNGISFAQAHAAYPFYLGEGDKRNDYLMMAVEKNIAICGYLGCPYLVTHSYCGDADTEKDLEINIEKYKRFIPAAKEHGVKICLENGFQRLGGRVADGGMCATPEEALQYLEVLNKAAEEEIFGFCLDTGHAQLLKKDIKRFIKKMDKHLWCLHLHENYEMIDNHLFPYTQICEGYSPAMDWERILEGLHEVGYRGAVSFETFRQMVMLPEELRPDALKYLSAIGRYFKSKIM